MYVTRTHCLQRLFCVKTWRVKTADDVCTRLAILNMNASVPPPILETGANIKVGKHTCKAWNWSLFWNVKHETTVLWRATTDAPPCTNCKWNFFYNFILQKLQGSSGLSVARPIWRRTKAWLRHHSIPSPTRLMFAVAGGLPLIQTQRCRSRECPLISTAYAVTDWSDGLR